MAAVPDSKLVYSGMLNRKASSAIASDRQRTAPSPAFDANSTATPPRMGSQINRLSNGSSLNIPSPCSVSRSAEPQPGDQGDQADDHRQGIVIEVAGLHPAQHHGERAHGARGAVHQRAVDELHVAHLPEEAAEPPAAAREHGVVDLVEVELVGEQAVQALRAFRDSPRSEEH